jgi:hypothetical protein
MGAQQTPRPPSSRTLSVLNGQLAVYGRMTGRTALAALHAHCTQLPPTYAKLGHLRCTHGIFKEMSSPNVTCVRNDREIKCNMSSLVMLGSANAVHRVARQQLSW